MIRPEQLESILGQLEYQVTSAVYTDGSHEVTLSLDFDSRSDARSFIHHVYESGLDNIKHRCPNCGKWMEHENRG